MNENRKAVRSTCRRITILMLAILLCAAMFTAGCGRRLQQQPPDETQTPPATQAPPAQDDAAPQETTQPAPQADALSSEDILFWDSFQDGDTAGWTVQSGWVTQQDGDMYWLQGHGECAAWIPSGLEWQSGYALRAAFNLQQGAAGFCFNATQAGRYIVWIDKDAMSLIKETDSGQTLLAQCAAPAQNQLHTIAAGIQGGTLQVYIDRALMLSAEDDDPLVEGTIVLTASADAAVYVDNVLVNVIGRPLPDLQPVSGPAEEADAPETDTPEAEAPLADALPEELPEDSEEFEDLPENNVPEELPQPTVSFTINGEESIEFEPGDEATVAWEVTDASHVAFNTITVDFSGSITDVLEISLVYELVVTAFDGSAERYTVRAETTEPHAPRGVDIIVNSVQVIDETTVGQPVSVGCTVENRGSTDAGAFTVAWYSYGDWTVSLSWDVNGLAAGESVSLSGEHPGYPVPGGTDWRLRADTENETGDINPSNNERIDHIGVTAEP